MKKLKNSLAIVSLVLLCALTLNLSGCVSAGAVDLMKGIIPGEMISLDSDTELCNDAASDFALKLFKKCYEGENTLISPLSVFTALSMTANGADSETLRQMEEVLGLSSDNLNVYLYSYLKNLPQGETYKLSIANSIWFKDSALNVKPEFLQTNANWYSAQAYAAPFDSTTIQDINNWCYNNNHPKQSH